MRLTKASNVSPSVGLAVVLNLVPLVLRLLSLVDEVTAPKQMQEGVVSWVCSILQSIASLQTSGRPPRKRAEFSCATLTSQLSQD